MKVTETKRLTLRWIEVEDAQFIFQLLNEPSWIQHIGDKGIYSVEDARNYIKNGPRKMYEEYGMGLFLVELKDDRSPIGICGLIKREELSDVDIGYAFLSSQQGKGYALESAEAMVQYAREIGLLRIIAITKKDNFSSSRLLEKLGMDHQGYVKLTNATEGLKLYSLIL